MGRSLSKWATMCSHVWVSCVFSIYSDAVNDTWSRVEGSGRRGAPSCVLPSHGSHPLTNQQGVHLPRRTLLRARNFRWPPTTLPKLEKHPNEQPTGTPDLLDPGSTIAPGKSYKSLFTVLTIAKCLLCKRSLSFSRFFPPTIVRSHREVSERCLLQTFGIYRK